MDQLIPAAEANRSFSRLLREVQGGQSFMVTAHGKPVARIVPCDNEQTTRSLAREQLLERLVSQPVADIGRWSRDELYER